MQCALDGAELLALGDRVYIEDIQEEIHVDMESGKRLGYAEIPLSAPRHSSMTITVTVMIKDRNRVRRAGLIQAIRGWAGKGWLTTNIHPGQRIYVWCVQPPNAETFDWTARMDIVFEAFGEAYWQDINPKAILSQAAASSASVVISPTGTRPCYLEAEITPESGTLTEATITVSGQKFELTGLEIAAGDTLSIWYDEMHLLHIEGGGESLLGCRSAESDDDLILQDRTPNTVGLSFDTACNYTIKARGLWK